MMSSPASHKPRKKKKTVTILTQSGVGDELIAVDTRAAMITPEFPAAAFLWPARGTTSQWIVIPVVLIIAGLFRWAVSLWGYSGLHTPPMHGDYEAQRHWMEITINLPISQWYFYDLQYWGLDYPPLTAYHSWLCGKVGSLLDKSWFALDTSRGLEQPLHKVFMRSTVLVSEYLVYVPALIIFLRHYSRNQKTNITTSSIALVAILMQPATILIDHGHFQYNTVMLGLVVATLSSIYAGRSLTACIFFVAALGFKQMALYYVPAIFAYLLGSCLTPRVRVGRLISIATITVIAFAILFAPILLGAVYDQQRGLTPDTIPPLLQGQSIDPRTPLGAALTQIAQVLYRCFPFARGLFEDKVANFWCSLNTFFKLHKLEGIIELSRLSAFFTIMSVLAPLLIVCAVPKKSLLPYAMASSAWGFFLFSFQVHEKSVLLPLLPMTLLLASKNGLSKEYRAWIGWANLLGVWTMYPLLSRDGLRTPYVIVTLLWTFLLGLPPFSASAYYDPEFENVPGRPLRPDDLRTPTKILHWQYYVIMTLWHLANGFLAPPEGKPDTWIVANACFGAFGFGICYLWCTWKLILESGLMDDYFQYRTASTSTDGGDDQKKTK